ncbi:MAG: hypothetical protein KF758_05485 [Anaerolineales bacterium]|nr:hypothetical protein [Anaerolineales bacterium]MBX3036348.1 hypothetical protein [Anaerolineales bacterium]
MKQTKELLSLLEDNIKTLYTSHEMSEILISLYGSVRIAIKMNADIFVVTPYQVFYLDKEGKIIYKFPEEVYDTLRISNIEVFDLILSRDKIVADLFEVVEKDEKEVKLKIKSQ